MTLALVILSLLLVFALYKGLGHRRAVHKLEQAIRERKPFLLEGLPGATGPRWDELCQTANELIADYNRLQQQRSGQLAQLEATLGSLQEAVLIVDSSNYVLLANRALQSIFPKAQNILHQRVELSLHSRDFLTFIDDVRAGRAQPQREVEFLEGNQSVWVEATGAMIPAAEKNGHAWALFVLHDITKQKKLEAVRKDFVANVSHELRTPLSIIKGYIETLADGHREIPPDDRDQFIRTIQRHAERLHSLLEDLLILSRLESKNPGLHRELVHLGNFTTSLVAEFKSRPAAQEHRIEVAVDPVIPEMLLDPLKMTQVFENLLENALKYTPKGSLITVSVKRHNADVEISVRDNGPGIPAADLPHLFERFYRVDKGRSREKGGTGLGLSIVKHIANLHSGRVWVESEVNKGTTFFVALPVRSGVASDKPQEAPGVAPTRDAG